MPLCPRLSPTVVLAPFDEGYLAFETAGERLHHLNPTASLIVELCDGTRDRSGLTALLRPLMGENAVDAVEGWITVALRDGLLVESEPGAAFEIEALSIAALAARVEALRDQGRILPAFVCQTRITELTPADALAWCRLGELAHILGRRDGARAAYERYLKLCPDDAEVGHILQALRDGPAPPRASDDCVTQLYARFAAFYDSSMIDDLGYEAPDRLNAALAGVLNGRRDLDILDLGCGTGLAGRRLRARARRLIGIDLSNAMLEHARRRRVYDDLHAAEITAWLNQNDDDESFDLIVACDALIYFGDLGQVIAPAARRLAPGGLIAFTVERHGGPFDFRLTDSGRYAHHPDHLTATAAANNLTVAHLEEATLRVEYGEPVVGLIAVFRAPI